jgi:hypothetical protein
VQQIIAAQQIVCSGLGVVIRVKVSDVWFGPSSGPLARNIMVDVFGVLVVLGPMPVRFSRTRSQPPQYPVVVFRPVAP